MNLKKELGQYKQGIRELSEEANKIGRQIQVLQQRRQQIINEMVGTNANIVLLERLVKESKEKKEPKKKGKW